MAGVNFVHIKILMSSITCSAFINLVQAVEQVTEAGPLQCWSRVERVEAGSESVVALLQNSFKQGQRLGQVALGIVVQLGQAVVHAF